MTVSDAVEAAVGSQDDPRVPVALRLAGLLDDPGTSARDASALSRELRMVLEELGGTQPVEAEGVFDLDARRREREKRRA